ncbi:hypothetical protein [Ralstonia sp. 24A2]|uniref:hypothetical protein n=1 Tax=Ralstonia sp. 24A2 TaxID=3447364 RepID=UPI003F6A52FD
MQQPLDMTGNLASATLRSAGQAAEFLLEAQIEFARMRLKIAEAALEDMREMEHELGSAGDLASLAVLQSTFAKMQSTHSATALRSWIDFINSLQAAYLRQLTSWNGQMQSPEAQTASAQLFTASADSLRSFFNSFSVAAERNAAAQEANQPQPAAKTPRVRAA